MLFFKNQIDLCPCEKGYTLYIYMQYINYKGKSACKDRSHIKYSIINSCTSCNYCIMNLLQLLPITRKTGKPPTKVVPTTGLKHAHCAENSLRIQLRMEVWNLENPLNFIFLYVGSRYVQAQFFDLSSTLGRTPPPFSVSLHHNLYH